MTEHQALVTLNLVTGMGAITAKRLIESFGSAAASLAAAEADLMAVPGIGAARAAQFRAGFAQADWAREERRAAEMGVRLVTWDEPDYPQLLRAIYDPPLVLYVCGDLAALQGTGVAVVGTRHPTRYGCESAHRFGFQLAGAGYVVVSGLARGIDAEAHRGALEARGRTVAVLGGALDCLYPIENRELAVRIAREGGAVVSEYPFGRQPDRQTFPMRNRIVSGLAAGVLVVEASLQSGTLITVDQAIEQGRTVMAMPGRIDSVASMGCHNLLRHGARLVTSVDDIAEEIQTLIAVPPTRPGPTPSAPAPAPVATGAGGGLNDDEQRLLAALGADDDCSVDDLVRASGLEPGRVNGLLVGLQIKRRIRLLPGARVTRWA
ncbi:MAG: DNA-protecting protein DprA [Lentisphaerae bacterium]|nr:DNA-protecting protein DprA [Lentisphaerota bacterium]